MNEHVRAFVKIARVEHHVVRGDVNDGERRGLFERHLVGHVLHLARIDDERVRVAAEFRHREHALSLGKSMHFFSDRIDRAGNFIADDARQLWRVGIQTDARHEIGKVDSGGAHANANFIFARLGIRLFAHLQNFRRSCLRDPNLTHRAWMPQTRRAVDTFVRAPARSSARPTSEMEKRDAPNGSTLA